MRGLLLVTSALGLGACRASASTPAPQDAGATTAALATITSAQLEGPTLDSMRADALRELNGDWVVAGADAAGTRQAWSVSGSNVRVHDVDRNEEWTATLTIPSPCELVRTRADGPARIVTSNAFVFAPDGLHLAPRTTPVGVRRGSLLTVCARGSVYTYDVARGRCDVWPPSMASASATPDVECSLVHDVGFDSFVMRPFGGGDVTRLTLQGDALLPTDPAASVAQRAPSWAEALRAAAAMPH